MTHSNTYNPASKNFNIGGWPDGHTARPTDGQTDARTDRNRYYMGSLLFCSSPKKTYFAFYIWKRRSIIFHL